MKQSIRKIFNNLSSLLIISFILLLTGLLFIIEQYHSFQTTSTLQNQKTILSKNIELQKTKDEIDIIQYNAHIATLKNSIEKIQKQSKYNYIGKYITKTEQMTYEKLKELTKALNVYDKDYRKYIEMQQSKKKETTPFNTVSTQYTNILLLIDSIIMLNLSADSKKFDIFSKLFVLIMLFLFLTILWQKNKFKNIYKDLVSLQILDSKGAQVNLFSQEADAIGMRMKRKSHISDNPTMVDSVTEINNHKGMIETYNNRKKSYENLVTSITVLEIDNFSKSKRAFSQDFTKEILKKVAYSISLHEQANDIIARTDYNQFTIITSRTESSQLFKDVDLIRQSIADIKTVTPDRKRLQVTVTGGFILKSKNTTLEETLKKAKSLLENAKQIGTNRVLQTKDIPKI